MDFSGETLAGACCLGNHPDMQTETVKFASIAVHANTAQPNSKGALKAATWTWIERVTDPLGLPSET